MSILKNMNPKDQIIYDDRAISGNYDQTLFLKRAMGNPNEDPIFYIRAYGKTNDELVPQGYIYFHLNHETKSSSFVGVKVEEEFRNLNIASFLVASWIDLCMNNGYDFLGVKQKQRKPFLLYLLKKYGFEVLDKSLYETRPDVIAICRDYQYPKQKLLLFKDQKHENAFAKTNVFKDDNYQLVRDTHGIVVLDNIILPLQGQKKANVNYSLLDEVLATEKTESTLKSHHR